MTASPRWLSAQEQRCWRQFLAACQTLFSAVDAQLLRDSGLARGYYEILVHLSEAPGRALRMTQLSAVSTFSKSRLSHAVSKLEDRGWVIRQDCQTDRRGQIARLTDEGFAVLAAAAPGHVEQVRRSMIDALSPEQLFQLGQISQVIIDAGRLVKIPPGADCLDETGCSADTGDADCLDNPAVADADCLGNADDPVGADSAGADGR